MWTDLLIFLPPLLSLVAVAAGVWVLWRGRKRQADAEAPDKRAAAGGGGGPTKPVPPK